MEFRTNYKNRPISFENNFEDNLLIDIEPKFKIPFGTIMDDDTITEQSGYETTQQIYESFIRSGINLQAHKLGIETDEVLERMDDIFESYGELDIVEQSAILQNAISRLENLRKEQNEMQEQKEPQTVPENKPQETPQEG